MRSTSSSACVPMPIERITASALRSEGGNPILTLLFFEKSVLDSEPRDRGLGASGQRVLQSIDGVAVGDVGEAGSRHRGGGGEHGGGPENAEHAEPLAHARRVGLPVGVVGGAHHRRRPRRG